MLHTRKPFDGVRPPNRTCAAPPEAIVPLPSTAGAPDALMTGSGAPEDAGVATLPTMLAGTLTGTSAPATSVWVEIDCSTVLPSFNSQGHGANLLIE